MKIPLSKTESFDVGAFAGKIYRGKKHREGFNALLIICKTRHYKTKLLKATRVYVVVEGNGTFTINNKKHTAKPYDFFMIKNGQTYEYSGKMKLLEFNIPATGKSNEEKLE